MIRRIAAFFAALADDRAKGTLRLEQSLKART